MADTGPGHGGVVDTKVGYFRVKLTKVLQEQMGTKPAKVAHRPSWPTKAAKVCRFCATKISPPLPPQVFAPRADQSC